MTDRPQRSVMSERDMANLRALAHRIDPEDAGAHNNLGVVFFQKGLTGDALAAFERALDLDPLLDVARRNARVAMRAAGIGPERVRELEGRLARDPDDDDARNDLARTRLLLNDPRAAAVEWGRLAERSAATAALHLRLAVASAEAEDHARAESAVRAALAADEGRAGAHALLARVLEAMGRAGEAAEARARAVTLSPGIAGPDGHLSIERFRSADGVRRVRAAPAEAGAALGAFARAVEHRRDGDLAGAARELESALASAGDEAGSDATDLRLSLAEVRLLQGSAAEAVALYDVVCEARPESPKAWNERGVALHRLGRGESAIESYRRAVALDHGYAPGWNNLGVALAQAGEAGRAERALRTAASEDAPAEVLGNLGLFLVWAGEPEDAVEACRAAVEADGESGRAWCRLGSALFQARQPEEARDALLRALEIEPRDAEARYQLGFVLSSLGDFQGALRETKRALELDPVVPAPRYQLLMDVQFEEGVVPAPDQDAPERVDDGTPIAEFEFEARDLDTAFSAFRIPEPGPDADVERALDEGRTALRRGQYDRAAEAAARAVAAAPGHPGALLLEGSVLLRRGYAGEALERFDAALAVAPDDAETLAGRARALLALARHPAAAEAAEAAARAGAEGGAALVGRAWLAAGDAERAVAAYATVADHAGAGDPVLVGYGEALLAADRPADAERMFRRAAAGTGATAAAHAGLARARSRLGDAVGAEASYRAAVAALPSHAGAALGLADLQWRTSRPQDALRTLVTFLEMVPTHVEALVRLGIWLHETGRPAQATVALRRALRFDPHHETAREALARAVSGAKH